MRESTKISVVMPTFNVQSYINEALDSVLEQADQNIRLEIIIVDDGSTDLTKNIIKNYQRTNPNIILIEQDSIGPGEARNIGMGYATGDYIAFLDGDDILYEHAYKKMLESAELNDADIVVGNVSRFNSSKSFFWSGLHRKIFTEEIIGTSILEYHNLLYDTTSWNKLFKASFLRDNNILFPVGILYEDIPFNMEAHLRSSNTNIILDYVYKWRLRDGTDDSITQSRTNEKNMLDRISAIKLFRSILEKNRVTDKAFLEAKELKEINLDLMFYINELRDVTEDYFLKFSEHVSEYVNNMRTDVFLTKLKSEARIKYRLVMEKKLTDIIHFLDNIKEYRELPIKSTSEGMHKEIADTPFAFYLTKEDIDMSNDVEPITKVQQVYWQNKKLVIEGFVFVKFLQSNRSTRFEAMITSYDREHHVSVPIEITKDKNITQIYGGGKEKFLIKRYYNYDFSHYKIVIDVEKKEIQDLFEEPVLVDIVIKPKQTTKTYQTFVKNPVRGHGPRPKDMLIESNVYQVSYDAQWNLKLTMSKAGGIATDFDLSAEMLNIKGKLLSKKPSRLIVSNHRHEITISDSSLRTEFELSVSINGLVKQMVDNEDYFLELADSDVSYSLFLEENLPNRYFQVGTKEIRFSRTKSDRIKISLHDKVPPKLDDIKLIRKNKKNVQLVLSLHQRYHVREEIIDKKSVQLVMIKNADGQEIKFLPSRIEIHQDMLLTEYTVDICEDDLHLFGNSSWLFYQIYSTNEQFYKRQLFIFRIPEQLTWRFKQNNFNLIANSSNYLQLNTSLEKSYFEKGPRRKKLLLDIIYPIMRKLPQNKKMIMFEAYWGRSYSCNPKAIYETFQREHPEYTFVWSFNNQYTKTSGNSIKVRRGSWQYYYYLARSKFFINNVNWPTEYEKRQGAVEIQTLHGTFLKTMGLDVTDEVNTQAKLKGFRRRHGRWDYLISPSSFMTEISRRVFEFQGTMLEYGFPRNDVLINQSIDINIIKNRLGIPEDKKVILYAPTYRTKADFKVKLDIERMKESLSDDYVLLFRLHYFVAKSLDLSQYEGFAYNVSNYSDIQELYCVSDILITDYSSVMFDFANLNRPMVFFTYDLEYYRDILRGMYLDFEKEAPGKLCRTTAELIDCLNNIESYQDVYSNKLRLFREKFNEYETGQAAMHVMNHILAKGEMQNEKNRVAVDSSMFTDAAEHSSRRRD